MSLTKTEINFYKTKGYLVKNKLISENEIKKINSLIRKILKKEEVRNTKIKNLGGSFNNNTKLKVGLQPTFILIKLKPSYLM